MAEADDIAPLLMNQVEYARHRGVSKQFIGKLVAEEKIALDQYGLIDVVAADLELGETRQRVKVEPESESSNNKRLTAFKAVGADYDARMAQLKYERELGKILPADGVSEAAAACGDALLRLVNGMLSARADAFVGHAKDVPTMRTFLRGVETEMLGKFSALFAKLEAEAVAQHRDAATAADQSASEPTLFDEDAA